MRPAFLLCVLMTCFWSAAADQAKQDDTVAAGSDSDWRFMLRVIKLERQFSTRDDGDYAEWGAFVRAAKKLDAFWLTTKGTTQYGETDSSEVRLFYSRTVKPYIDLHLGWRRDLKPEPERDWLGFGVLGILPYRVGADASFFIGESGRFALRLEFAYKHWITQKLSLSPDIEANLYSQDDLERGIGSGLSDLDLGLRLRYEVINGVSPYAGLIWKGNFGKTADIIESRGEEADDLRVMLGISLRY